MTAYHYQFQPIVNVLFVKADLTFNRGKDFTGDTVEVTGRTDPSSFISASVLDTELWSYGWNTFITEEDVSYIFVDKRNWMTNLKNVVTNILLNQMTP